jgi:TM2 domain-containing membrane protein YozV
MNSAHHVSDVDTWGGPDRNWYVFVALSFLTGFFGLDHFYLRSFGTGTQKLLLNLFGLGLWYFWDLSQIIKDGAKVRAEGLSSPFDWIRGIGRGVFLPLSGGGTLPTAQKSYLIYTALALFLGFVGADKFYIGEYAQGALKLISCFNIFIFLFGWMWVAWDAFHAFFMTKSILKDGISPPVPLNYVFSPTSGEIFRIHGGGTTGGAKCFTDWLLSLLPTFPRPNMDFVRNTAKEFVPLIATPPIVAAIEELRAQVPPTIVPTITEPVAVANAAPTEPMRGGARSDDLQGPGPIIAGVLTAIVLAGGLKGTYDFIKSQTG